MELKACLDVVALENYMVSRNCSFMNQRLAKPWFRKKRSKLELLKLIVWF
jgi:hypothetical protein